MRVVCHVLYFHTLVREGKGVLITKLVPLLQVPHVDLLIERAADELAWVEGVPADARFVRVPFELSDRLCVLAFDVVEIDLGVGVHGRG